MIFFPRTSNLHSLNEAINYEEDKSVYVDNTPESHIMKALQFGANYNYSIMFSKLLMENLATSPFKKWGRGIHQNDFYLLKKMTCPAVLVETAFISNPDEYQLLASAKWREEIAERLFKAFKEFKKAYDESVSSPVNETVDNDASTSAAESPYYSIQVMGLGRRLSSTDPAFKGLPCAAVKVPSSNIYKYIYENIRQPKMLTKKNLSLAFFSFCTILKWRYYNANNYKSGFIISLKSK